MSPPSRSPRKGSPAVLLGELPGLCPGLDSHLLPAAVGRVWRPLPCCHAPAGLRAEAPPRTPEAEDPAREDLGGDQAGAEAAPSGGRTLGRPG